VDTCGLSAIQLHGQETPAFCTQFDVKVIKAFRVKGSRFVPEPDPYKVDAILLDTFKEGVPGGTGVPFDWNVASDASRYGKIILAGGLNCENVGRVLAAARPYALDVSSGVEERPGKKDPDLLTEFVKKVRSFPDS
jgi:phosphoribosylanthranilate isomerase